MWSLWGTRKFEYQLDKLCCKNNSQISTYKNKGLFLYQALCPSWLRRELCSTPPSSGTKSDKTATILNAAGHHTRERGRKCFALAVEHSVWKGHTSFPYSQLVGQNTSYGLAILPGCQKQESQKYVQNSICGSHKVALLLATSLPFIEGKVGWKKSNQSGRSHPSHEWMKRRRITDICFIPSQLRSNYEMLRNQASW